MPPRITATTFRSRLCAPLSRRTQAAERQARSARHHVASQARGAVLFAGRRHVDVGTQPSLEFRETSWDSGAIPQRPIGLNRRLAQARWKLALDEAEVAERLREGGTHGILGGMVQLGLKGRTRTARAAAAMTSRVQTARPESQLEGFLVQPMLSRPKAQEVLAGLVRDPTFGPVPADRALALPPLNIAMARDAIARTRVSRLLGGYRDRPAADLDALGRILVALGRLASDIPEIAELDLNPILCDADGALVVDARIAVRRTDPATARMAILPYPSQLRRTENIGGESLMLRPIHPRDAPKLIEMIERCTPEDRRLRFCGGILHLNPALARQLCQVDYDRHMALLLETASGEILGVGCLVEDPQGGSAEFVLIVRSDRQNCGPGRLLLQAVPDYGLGRGLTEVWGDVAADNPRMLGMTHAFGFTTTRGEADPWRVQVTKRLEPVAAAAG